MKGECMAVIQITAFVIIVLLLSFYWKESFVSVLPCAVCGLVLFLYVLALCGCLSFIDYVGIAVLSGTGSFIILRKRRDILGDWRDTISEPSFLASAAMICIVCLCVSDKMVTWWDDINFWATDVKSLYYLDGFSGKYGNVAPEFGDYPPAAQLFKWWFLHLDRHTFREGLAFAGYHIMNLVFLFPLFGALRRPVLSASDQMPTACRPLHLYGKKATQFTKISFIAALMGAALWMFPGIAEIYGYHGFCADLTMACIYGSFLYAVTDSEGHSTWFYRLRLILYLSVLVLVKSVGFIWAFFGLVFFFLYQVFILKDKKILSNRFFSFSLVAAPLLSGGSWMAFCLLMRRVTKTTATAVKYLVTDEYTWSLYRKEFTEAFIRALFTEPLHKERSFCIDLTPFGYYVLICILLYFFYKKCLLSKKQGILFLWFSVMSGAVMYAVIFVSHLTIFANETQYLEASAMVSSIERYGAPFTVGTLLFLSLLWINRGDTAFQGLSDRAADKNALWSKSYSTIEKYGIIILFIFFVFLTTGWQNGFDGLIGYRAKTEENLQERRNMADRRSLCFLDTLQAIGAEESTRVLCIQCDLDARWVRNSYTNFQASPISVVYLNADLNNTTGELLADGIRASHASYLYADQADAKPEIPLETMPEQGSFKLQTLYRIENDGARIRLIEVKERHGE